MTEIKERDKYKIEFFCIVKTVNKIEWKYVIYRRILNILIISNKSIYALNEMQFKCRLNADFWDADQSAFYLPFKF